MESMKIPLKERKAIIILMASSKRLLSIFLEIEMKMKILL
jgi:hypothetical protein